MNRSLVVALAGLSLFGCASRPEVRGTPRPDVPVATRPPPQPAAPVSTPTAAGEAPPALAAIHYGLDAYRLDESATDELQALADYLKRHPKTGVAISGHTCELGTEQYNLELGNRRAEGVRSYLIALGVSPDRISTISYGEERPAVEGHSDEVRALNRRSEISLRAAFASASR